MLPASKVSVPLTVVMRTWVSVSDRVFDPATTYVPVPAWYVDPEAEKTFDPSRLNVIAPWNVFAAVKPVAKTIPAVDVTKLPTALFPMALLPEMYPVVSMPPESPIWAKKALAPFVLTPLNITVIRFTQDGMLVKSIDVPDVEATAVPEVIAPPWMVLFVSVCVSVVPTTAPAVLPRPPAGKVTPAVPEIMVVIFKQASSE